MTGVDVVAGKYSSVTPYNYAFNDPVGLNDPTGADPYQSSTPQGWSFEQGDWYDKRPPMYFRDYTNNPGSVDGHVYMGSGYNWSDQFSDKKRDYFLMHGSAFETKYGESVLDYRKELYIARNSSDPTSSDIAALSTFLGVDVEFSWNKEGQSGYWIDKNYTEDGTVYVTSKFVQTSGGRLFENEGDAYRFMWNSSFDADGNVSNEVAAFLTTEGVLVLPTEGRRTNGEYARNSPRTSYNDFLPLGRKGGNLYVTFDGNRIQVLGQVHTHPNTQPFGNYEVAPDLGIQNFLRVPINIMRTNGFYNLNKEFLGTRQDFYNGTKSLFGR